MAFIDVETMTTEYDFIQLANILVAIAFLAAGILSLVYIAYGGLQFIMAGGDNDKLTKATHTMRGAVIGLILIIISMAVVTMVGRIFGIELISYLNFSSIKQIIESLSVGNMEGMRGL